MNKKLLLFYITSLLIVFSSCNKSTNLADSIPSDALYVVRVDAESIIKKSEYDLFKNSMIQRGINVGKAFLPDDQVKILDQFLNDANALGLDLKGQYYLYQNQSEIGLILKVLDVNKLNSNLSILAKNSSSITKDGDVSVFEIQNNSIVVWNKNKLVYLNQLGYAFLDNSSQDLVSYAKGLLNQSQENSIAAQKTFKTFLSEEKDVTVYYSLEKAFDFFLANADLDDTEAAKIAKLNNKGVSIANYINFEKGKINITGNYLFDSKESEERFLGDYKQFSREIKGDQFKYIPNKPLFLASANIDGSKFYKYLNTNKILEDNMPKFISDETLRNILSNVDGDITFALSNISIQSAEKVNSYIQQDASVDDDSIDLEFEEYSYQDKPFDIDSIHIDVVLLANVVNQDSLLASINNQIRDRSANEIDTLNTNIYKVKLDANNTLFYGVKDQLFFATTSQNIYNSVLEAKPLKDHFTYPNFSKKSMLITGDVEKLNTEFLSEVNPLTLTYRKSLEQLLIFTSLFNTYGLSTEYESMSFEGNVYMNNTNDNSLKTICLYVDKLITEAVSNIF